MDSPRTPGPTGVLATRPARRRASGKTVALGASVAVHLVIGAYLITSTFHPFNRAQPEESPLIVVETLRPVTPDKPPPPRPATPPRLRPRVVEHPRLVSPDPLPILQDKAATETISTPPPTLGDGLVTAPPPRPRRPRRSPIPSGWPSRTPSRWERPIRRRRRGGRSAGR